MSNALATVEPQDHSIAGYNEEQVDIIRNTVAPDLNDNELKLFLTHAQRTGLDPFSRQIYAFKNKGRVSIGAYIDGLRLIADRTEKYAPGKETEYEVDGNGNLIAARAYVQKWMEGPRQFVEVSEVAYMDEFGQGGPTWAKMPRVMLAKCAEARALRRAFPAELSGLYEKAEEAAIVGNAASAPSSKNAAFNGAIQGEAQQQEQAAPEAEVVDRNDVDPVDRYTAVKAEVWDLAKDLYGTKSAAEAKLREMCRQKGYVFAKLDVGQLEDILDSLHVIVEERAE